MEDKSKKENPHFKVHKSFTKKQWLIIGVIATIVVVAVVAISFLLITKIINISKDNSGTQKVLTVKDLDNPDVSLTSNTSNASVNNLKSGLKTEIDKQVAAKNNPFETVKELAGVLSNTTSQNRQDQLTNFLEDFLTNHENELWYKTESGTPDQAQVNYWEGQLYAYLVYNFQNIMESKLTDSNGRPIITTKQQLKYINLYLALAKDPASNPPIAEKDKEFFVGYVYQESSTFLEMKNRLIAEGTV